MRGIALLLIVANICVAAYSHLAAIGETPNPLHAAFRPERIKLLTPQAVAALGPGKVALLNISCAEWGPFTERERTTALEVLNPLQLGKTLSQQRVEIAKPFWVSVTGKAGKGGLDRTLKELESLGFDDVAIVKVDDINAISAGVFRTEDAARARLAALEAKGINSAKVLPREQALGGTLIVIREPQQATVAALEAAKAKLPDVALAFSSCRDRPAG